MGKNDECDIKGAMFIKSQKPFK